jgi:hypothetical protein
MKEKIVMATSSKNNLDYESMEHLNNVNLMNEKKNLIDLVGARVVRGPDWKWAKQDGFLIFYFIILDLFYLSRELEK